MIDKRVNSRQLDVLRWIVDGCPDGVMTDFTYKTTTYALRSRGLASVSKKGGTWRAAPTDVGRYYLEHGSYPEAERSATATKPVRRPDAKRAAPRVAEPEAGKTHDATAVPATPPGPPEPAKPQLPRVDVPGALRRPHAAVVALRDDKDHFHITRGARNRALRILQGLVTASERKGYTAREVRCTHNGYGHASWESKDHLVIETGETTIGVRVVQESDRTPHEPTAYELQWQERWGSRPPKYDHTPSDRLRIEIGSTRFGDRSVWRDGARGSLEGKLGDLLRAIELRHEYAVAQRIKEEQAQLERERQWRIAVEEAKVLLRESHRADVLLKDVAAWRRAGEVREYLRAMEAELARERDPGKAAAGLEWLEWATRYVESMDPLGKPIAMPEDPVPTDQALAPFLPSRHSYGIRAW